MQRVIPVSALTALSLALAAALPMSAQAASASWAATRTLATDNASAKMGSELQAGTQVHISVSLNLRNKAELDALTSAIMSGKTSRTLSTEEMLARHAPSVEQAQAVADYLRSSGFGNVEISKNRHLVSADGSAASIKAAFKAELHHVDVDGRSAIGTVTPAMVPAHLAGIVSAVHGLDTTHTLNLYHKVADAKVAAGGIVGHNPMDFSTIYDADGLPAATKTTVAIIAAGDISQSLTDLSAFVTQNGLQPPVIEQVAAGPQSSDTAGVIEWDLDSQTALSTAGGAVQKMIFYVGKDVTALTSVVEAFNRAAADNEAKVVNASLGLCETGELANGDETAIDASLEMGVAQGQTWTISSGDSGAYECTSKKVGASYPAVSPFALAIGGTTLTTTGTTIYASESAWSCGSQLGCLLLGGAGGGTSVTEAAPDWQTQALGPLTGRVIPDISFSADPASGAILVVNGGNGTEQVGGTSLSAPMFMGFWARIQTRNNNTLTTPNANLYKYSVTSRGTQYLHDVTTGSIGFPAGPGWDLATGFGSVDIGKVSALIDKLKK